MVDRAESDLETLTAATFEPVRVRRASDARGRLVTAAWMLGLVGIAGLAVVGRLTELGAPSRSSDAIAQAREVTSPTAAPTPAGAPRTSQRDAPNPPVPASPTATIVLNSPARGTRLTTVDVAVGGYLQADASSVRVALETVSEVVLSQATVLPALVFGERPEANRHLQFRVRLVLPARRPTGAVAVRVVAFDQAGQQIAMLRRPFTLAPIVRPTLGDDGLLGGLVFSGS